MNGQKYIPFLSSPIACVACERTELLKTEITDPKMEVIFLMSKFSMLLWYLWYVYCIPMVCISSYGMDTNGMFTYGMYDPNFCDDFFNEFF